MYLLLFMLIRSVVVLLFHCLDKFFERGIHDFYARSASPLMTNHAEVVDNVKRRCGREIPFRSNRSGAGVAFIDE